MQASQLALILGCQSHCCASRRMRRLNRIFVGESLSFAYLDPVTTMAFGGTWFVRCMEAVRISESPLWEVPL